VRSACDNLRRTRVRNGHEGHSAPEHRGRPRPVRPRQGRTDRVVRGGIEPPTFRFSGRAGRPSSTTNQEHTVLRADPRRVLAATEQQPEQQRHRTAPDLCAPGRGQDPGHTESPDGLGRLASGTSLSLNPQVGPVTALVEAGTSDLRTEQQMPPSRIGWHPSGTSREAMKKRWSPSWTSVTVMCITTQRKNQPYAG
jgi:hypothetical protein